MTTPLEKGERPLRAGQKGGERTKNKDEKRRVEVKNSSLVEDSKDGRKPRIAILKKKKGKLKCALGTCQLILSHAGATNKVKWLGVLEGEEGRKRGWLAGMEEERELGLKMQWR